MGRVVVRNVPRAGGVVKLKNPALNRHEKGNAIYPPKQPPPPAPPAEPVKAPAVITPPVQAAHAPISRLWAAIAVVDEARGVFASRVKMPFFESPPPPPPRRHVPMEMRPAGNALLLSGLRQMEYTMGRCAI